MYMYDEAKEMFLNGISLREIGRKLNIDRKKLSLKLREEGIKTSNKMSKEEIKKAKQMYNAGMSLDDISDNIGISRSTISNKFDEISFRKIKRRKNFDKYDSEIIKCYKEDMSIEKISKKFNFSTNKIYRTLLKNNINTSDVSRYRKHHYTENFSKIDTPEKAYWLGFLYADGYINTGKGEVTLMLSIKDEDSINQFLNFMGDGRKYYRNIKGYEQVGVSIYSKEISENLSKHGCFNNKAKKIEYPKIKPELNKHFIRGYFDGDGSFYYRNKDKTLATFSIISASKPFLINLKEILVLESNIDNININMSSRKDYFGFYVNKKKDLKLIFEYLYDNEYSNLKRKKSLFQEFLTNAVLGKGHI